MPEFIAQGREFERYLPHRGRNMIIDSISITGRGDGRVGLSSLSFSGPDAEARRIFLQKSGGRDVVSEFAMVEHIALTSSVMIFRDIESGKAAFFSTITSFERDPGFEPAAAEGLRGRVVPLKGRGAFHRSKGVLLDRTGAEAVSVEIMAVVMDRGSTGSGETAKFLEKPMACEGPPIDRSAFPYKQSDFVFVDSECLLYEAGPGLTARYTYPLDHPFCEGHFPGNPVMMGVAQWAAALDASAWLARRAGVGRGLVSADADIVREDGAAVCEIRGLVFQWEGPDSADAPKIISTRKIGFRDVIKAGDTVFVRTAIRRADGA